MHIYVLLIWCFVTFIHSRQMLLCKPLVLRGICLSL